MRDNPESRMWQKLREAMRGRWLSQRHEDGRVGPGVPDVSFVMARRLDGYNHQTGWLELKSVPEWTGVIPHLTGEQMDWMRFQHNAGIPVFLLVEVRNTKTWGWWHGASIDKFLDEVGIEQADFYGTDLDAAMWLARITKI